MLAWTEQVKRRGLSEQPIDTRVVTNSCNIKLINGITWINVNHSNSTALERSVIIKLGTSVKNATMRLPITKDISISNHHILYWLYGQQIIRHTGICLNARLK